MHDDDRELGLHPGTKVQWAPYSGPTKEQAQQKAVQTTVTEQKAETIPELKKEYVIIKANAQPTTVDPSLLNFKPYLMPDSFPADGTWIVERNVATGYVSAPFEYKTEIENTRNLNKVAGNPMEWAYTTKPNI